MNISPSRTWTLSVDVSDDGVNWVEVFPATSTTVFNTTLAVNPNRLPGSYIRINVNKGNWRLLVYWIRV